MKILLTRPLEDSVLTSKILKQFLIESDISPLIKIKKQQVDYNFSPPDILIFTSKNGVRSFDFEHKIVQDNILVISVGTETKKLIKQRTNLNVINVNGDLSALKIKVAKLLKKKMFIVHPTSSNENPKLKDFFLKFNCKYKALKCYNSLMVNENKDVFKKFLISYEKGIISLYSSLTAKAFVKEVMKYKLQNFCKKKRVVVISAKVKKELNMLPLSKIFIAEKPNERNMVELIKKISRGDKIA